jgi:hypothetical protein
MVVNANSLPKTPTAGEVFDRRFLPPLGDRVRKF